jgi:hypothetical protein
MSAISNALRNTTTGYPPFTNYGDAEDWVQQADGTWKYERNGRIYSATGDLLTDPQAEAGYPPFTNYGDPGDWQDNGDGTWTYGPNGRVYDASGNMTHDPDPIDTEAGYPPFTEHGEPGDWTQNADGTWTFGPNGRIYNSEGYLINDPTGLDDSVVPPDTGLDKDPRPKPPAPPQTQYIPGIGPLPTSGTAPPRFNMPNFQPATPAAQQPTGGPVPGLNAPPTGQVSGPARNFTPFGQPMGQFSAPRQYGGLPRSTGPWGVPGAWYGGQGAIAAALRGS